MVFKNTGVYFGKSLGGVDELVQLVRKALLDDFLRPLFRAQRLLASDGLQRRLRPLASPESEEYVGR